jgi:glycosyltransferase involved in cell wall biosynthesis
MISAIVLVKNEEERIEKCLKSLLWCDEIIIVDDYSEDKTLERIKISFSKGPAYLASPTLGSVHNGFAMSFKNNKIKIFQRNLEGDFSKQRNFGLEKAKGEWVLFVDADEVVTGELKNEIGTKLRNEHGSSGFYIKRRDYFLGKWLKYGEVGRIKLLRLARSDAGRWEGRVHEVWNVKDRTGELVNPLHHFPHKNISSFLQKINYYTDLVVQCWKEEGRKMHFWEVIFYPSGKFIQNYIIRLGLFDGTAGLIMAFMMSFHSFLSRAKYYLCKNE